MIPGTKSSLYVEEIFEFSDILYGTHISHFWGDIIDM